MSYIDKKVCLRDRDIEFLKFLAEYGIIKNENVKLFYNSEYYYRNRLASLAKGKIIERLYGKVVLGRNGKIYLNKIGIGYRNINRNETYKKRLERISDICCKIRLCGWYFEPSWKCNLSTYTKRGNRYFGVMSRLENVLTKNGWSYYKKSYIVYYFPKDITQKELRYIYKEIDRNKNTFRGLIVIIEDDVWKYHKNFEHFAYGESYLIPHNESSWKILNIINDETFMPYLPYEVYGDKLESIVNYSIFREYYFKEGELTTYVYYMPFLNFFMLKHINENVNDKSYKDTEHKLVCLDNCILEARKYLDEKVQIICFET